MKAENRNPKAEGSPKPKVRKEAGNPTTAQPVTFGNSGFGFRPFKGGPHPAHSRPGVEGAEADVRPDEGKSLDHLKM